MDYDASSGLFDFQTSNFNADLPTFYTIVTVTLHTCNCKMSIGNQGSVRNSCFNLFNAILTSIALYLMRQRNICCISLFVFFSGRTTNCNSLSCKFSHTAKSDLNNFFFIISGFNQFAFLKLSEWCQTMVTDVYSRFQCAFLFLFCVQ